MLAIQVAMPCILYVTACELNCQNVTRIQCHLIEMIEMEFSWSLNSHQKNLYIYNTVSMVHTSVRFSTFLFMLRNGFYLYKKCSRSFSVSNEAYSVGDDKFISSKRRGRRKRGKKDVPGIKMRTCERIMFKTIAMWRLSS